MTRMKQPHANPCNECPWRRSHPAGWLGPMSADEWIVLALSDEPIACHQTIPEGFNVIDDSLEREYATVEMTQCAGAAIFRANISKLPRDRAIGRLPKDPERVFAHPGEFKNHHQRTKARHS